MVYIYLERVISMTKFITKSFYVLLIFSLGFLCARELQRFMDAPTPTFIHNHIYVPPTGVMRQQAPPSYPNEESANYKLSGANRT